MKLYVVRNKEGKFFKTIGYGGQGKSWVDGLDKAKFYTKIGQAKSRVTFFYKQYPQYGCPEILEFDIDVPQAKIIDGLKETEKKIKDSKIKEIKRRIKNREWEISHYISKINSLGQSQLDELEKKKMYILIDQCKEKIKNDIEEIKGIK